MLAFIPNSAQRDSGTLYAKLLKTRDSSGVGSLVSFRTDWATLTFSPIIDNETVDYSKNKPTSFSNKTDRNYDSGNENDFGVKRQNVKKEQKKTILEKAEDEEVDDITSNTNSKTKISSTSVLTGLRSKNQINRMTKVL